ncbi:MAG: outer membrane lipoprotein-sorting protein [Betaproteobacteria bacterium]|nr:outer membrane lipoprotein-sorting protein [Betaproteobacteria bacterium]
MRFHLSEQGVARRRALLLGALAMPVAGIPRGLVRAEEPVSGEVDEKAVSIVRRADEIRFPSRAFEVFVKIRSVESGGSLETRDLRVWSKGNDNTIVQTLAPASERGQILLMKGRDLWLFVPNVSQPVRLSLAQRLTGVVSNGDIARANFSGDYSPRITGSEAVGGEKCHVLELSATERGVAYQKVKYWVRIADDAPVKAEFYSISDRLLKTCSYEGYKSLGGRVRPTRLVMTDAIRADTHSVMEYGGMKMVDLPDKIFTKEYLKKLQ